MSREFSNRRRPHRRRPQWEPGQGSVTIRVGSKHSSKRYQELRVMGPNDAGRFARMVDDLTRAAPREPLIVSVNGYQPWLGDVLRGGIHDNWSDISDLARETQFAGTMQFPEKASKRGGNVPWTFILDHINVPQVYYWSTGMEPPEWDDIGLPSMDRFRFRTGVWTCGKGALRVDSKTSVTLIFTKPTPVSEHIVTELMFPYFYNDEDFGQLREDEEGICWIFSRLYYLLTDWQNVIGDVVARLDEAEANSHGKNLPVKQRTRAMHKEVDRLYEMKEYMAFHSRAFKKLQKLKDAVPKNEQDDPLWDDIDDALDDLDQFDGTLDGLKERFNNLIELEFNIQSAVQSDNGQFLTGIATLFLPVSYLASIWGITEITWRPMWYLWTALPVFLTSVLFLIISPWAMQKISKYRYPIEAQRITLQPDQFTMLGDELPNSVNVASSSSKAGKPKHKGLRPADNDDTRARSRSRPGSEKY